MRSAACGSASRRATRSPNAREVGRVDEDPVAPSSIWSWMPPTRRRRPGALPHRLGDRQPEALGEALLHDDVGAALQRVDDHRVLVDVLHRQQREVHAPADVARQVAPRGLGLARTSAPSGSSATAVTSGPASTSAALVGGTCSANARHDPERVLQAIPARDLRDAAARRGAARLLDHPRRALTRPTLPSSRSKIARGGGGVGGEAGGAQTAVTPVNAIAWFFGEKASIDGGDHRHLARSSPSHA